MTPLVRDSILRRFSVLVCCAFTAWGSASLAFAQHPVPHPGGTVVHVAPPPVFRSPMVQPIPRAPVMYAPAAASRMSTVSPIGAMGAIAIRPPRRPVRPFPVILFYNPTFIYSVPFWGFNSCGWTSCDLLWPWTYENNNISSPGPISYAPQVYGGPSEVYGAERPDLPELDLKDGTTLDVSDYWVVDNQLHFMIASDFVSGQ